MTNEFCGIDYRQAGRLIYGADFYDSSDKPNCSDGAVELHLIEKDISDVSSHSAKYDPQNNNAAETNSDCDRDELDAAGQGQEVFVVVMETVPLQQIRGIDPEIIVRPAETSTQSN